MYLVFGNLSISLGVIPEVVLFQGSAQITTGRGRVGFVLPMFLILPIVLFSTFPLPALQYFLKEVAGFKIKDERRY